MGAHRSKGLKEERTSRMRDTSCDGLGRHSDNDGWRVATERTPVISVLNRSTRNFLAVVRRVL
jgi:hypothetical protein